MLTAPGRAPDLRSCKHKRFALLSPLPVLPPLLPLSCPCRHMLTPLALRVGSKAMLWCVWIGQEELAGRPGLVPRTAGSLWPDQPGQHLLHEFGPAGETHTNIHTHARLCWVSSSLFFSDVSFLFLPFPLLGADSCYLETELIEIIAAFPNWWVGTQKWVAEQF